MYSCEEHVGVYAKAVDAIVKQASQLASKRSGGQKIGEAFLVGRTLLLLPLPPLLLLQALIFRHDQHASCHLHDARQARR